MLGGDTRSITAFNILKNYGYDVSSNGLFENDNGKVENADIVLLPVPSTKDNVCVFCPRTSKTIYLDELKEKAENKYIISGGYEFSGLDYTDILSLDSYAYLNAVPTAEGAVSFAIEHTPFTLWKSNILIIGFGRVGKVLATRLKNFGCNLTVSARKQADFAILDTQGIEYIDTSLVTNSVPRFDIIYNTIDIPLFENPELLKDKLLIDLSSKGCIDFEKAKLKGIRAYKLSGIPAKYSPETAGKIYADTVIQLIKNR